MARGDGIDRTSARNAKMTAAKVGNAQAHNERQKESYHHLEKADRTVFDDYISDILAAKYVYRILRDTIGYSFGSDGYKYHISEENFRPLFANPELVDRLLEERPPETDDEKFVFRVYQVFKHGGKDEFGEASVLTAEAVELSL